MPNTESDGSDPHPQLTPDQDRAQRGHLPPNASPTRPRPDFGPVDPQRRAAVMVQLQKWLDRKGRTRQDGLWPYLLARAYAGDHGVRPVAPQPFWESPDVLVVPGVVQEYDGVSATLTPAPGQPHTVFVHAWNIGRLVAVGVKVSVYWGNPGFSFDDSSNQPQLIGASMLTLPDRLNSACHRLVRIPTPWTPIVVNDGHECLLARVECLADAGGVGWNARMNRHIAQRNVQLMTGAQSLEPLLVKLSTALPARSELHLLHGMGDVSPVIVAHAPRLSMSVTAPAQAPRGGFALSSGVSHLGAALPSAHLGGMVTVPASVVGPALQAGALAASLVVHPLATPVPAGMTEPAALLHQLGVTDLMAGTVAARLGDTATEGHILRFQAMRDGEVIGGYTIIVRG